LICIAIIVLVLFRSSDSRPIAWFIIGIFVGIYLFIQGFRLLQRRHLILDTPASKVRSASLGMVELSGLAAGPYTTVAPITERSCYYYRTVAWEWKQQGKNKQWVKVAAECMHVPFFIDDNTGKVMVDPRGADLDLHRDFQQEFCDGFFTTKQEAPPNVHSFLLRHGVSTTNKIKVEEFCIKPKNALFLLGTLEENPGIELSAQPIQDAEVATFGPSGALSFSTGGGSALSFMGGVGFSGSTLPNLAPSRGSEHVSEDERLLESVLSKPNPDRPSFAQPSQVIHLSPTAVTAGANNMTQQQKIAAALTKAGISNPAAWAAAGVSPVELATSGDPDGLRHSTSASGGTQAAPATAAPPEQFEQHPRVVLMKGKNNSTFVISWRSQRELANSLGWKCTLMIWGGPALILLCLYGLHTMTHWF
jgi:E3 Ubiquitin ligase